MTYHKQSDITEPEERPISERAFNWGINGSVLGILVLTLIYLFFPVDAIPDFLPIAGQLDDLAAVAAGGGSITFLTIMRYVLRTRAGRWGCLIFLALTAVGAFTIFWILLKVFDSIF